VGVGISVGAGAGVPAGIIFSMSARKKETPNACR
jgi:hypothetical protein